MLPRYRKNLIYSIYINKKNKREKYKKYFFIYMRYIFSGNIGNIDAVNSQAYGGLAHSIGFALQENYDDVKKHANMIGAGIDQIKDIPDNFNLHHMDHPREEGPWGSSGASEAFQSSGHMAVINAINNACGVRIYELPATKDKIKAGLDKLAAGEKVTPPEKYDLGDFWAELEYCRDNPKENE